MLNFVIAGVAYGGLYVLKSYFQAKSEQGHRESNSSHFARCSDADRRKWSEYEEEEVFKMAPAYPGPSGSDRKKRACPECGTQIYRFHRVAWAPRHWESTETNRWAWHIDHKHPHSKGGCNCMFNLQPLCDRCNTAKLNRV